jgi:hypothetical protein
MLMLYRSWGDSLACTAVAPTLMLMIDVPVASQANCWHLWASDKELSSQTFLIGDHHDHTHTDTVVCHHDFWDEKSGLEANK